MLCWLRLRPHKVPPQGLEIDGVPPQALALFVVLFSIEPWSGGAVWPKKKAVLLRIKATRWLQTVEPSVGVVYCKDWREYRGMEA